MGLGRTLTPYPPRTMHGGIRPGAGFLTTWAAVLNAHRDTHPERPKFNHYWELRILTSSRELVVEDILDRQAVRPSFTFQYWSDGPRSTSCRNFFLIPKSKRLTSQDPVEIPSIPTKLTGLRITGRDFVGINPCEHVGISGIWALVFSKHPGAADKVTSSLKLHSGSQNRPKVRHRRVLLHSGNRL